LSRAGGVAGDPRFQDPEFLANPYPLYAQLRADAPAYWHGGLNRWLIARYADVDRCLRDPRFSSERTAAISEVRAPHMRVEIAPLTQVIRKQVAFCDPPDHTRLRTLINHALTPRAVQRLQPFIQETVDSLLDACASRGEMDLVEDFASPLPGLVIARMLGIPGEDRPRFRTWSQSALGFLGSLTPTEAQDRTALAHMAEAALYCFSKYQSQLFQPRNDTLLSLLVQATEQGDLLTNEEVVANALLIVLAGHETITHAISTAVLSLMRHRDQWERLKAEPTLVESAAEELLRYESPFQFVTRTVLEDVEIGGATVRAGDTIMLLLGSANRDADVFVDPDDLDVGRASNRHLAFGRGIHFCLGAPLARLQIRAALESLARRLPDLRLASPDVTWVDNFEFRGVTALPVTWKVA
jgi:cytochrome P450